MVTEEYWQVWSYSTGIRQVNLTSMTIYMNYTPPYTRNSTHKTNATFTWSRDIGTNPLSLQPNTNSQPSQVITSINGTHPIVTAGVTV